MIMCRMTRPSGNLQRAGVTGHTLTRTVFDLLRSRRPLVLRPTRMRGSLGAYPGRWPRPTRQKAPTERLDER
jgi:hypothetical protein